MPTTTSLIAFALLSLGLLLTPGPNMLYLTSRSLCQGRKAGLISLSGVALGFVFYMLCAAFGITAFVMAVPFAYDGLRLGGAAYLLCLAWQAIRPGGRSPFQLRDLPPDSPGRLFAMGLLTNLLNPKIAVMYLSLLPQFIHPERGSILTQALILGMIQIVIGVGGDCIFVLMAGSVASFLNGRPAWLVVQRWFMATVLGGLAVRMAIEARR